MDGCRQRTAGLALHLVRRVIDAYWIQEENMFIMWLSSEWWNKSDSQKRMNTFQYTLSFPVKPDQLLKRLLYCFRKYIQAGSVHTQILTYLLKKSYCPKSPVGSLIYPCSILSQNPYSTISCILSLRGYL